MKKRVSLWIVLASLLCLARMAEAVPPAFIKNDNYPMEDSYAAGIDPNVLFLLDTGSPMVMSPRGRMPLVQYIWDPNERAGLLAECTYGTGSRPMVSITADGTITEPSANPALGAARAERYGRDLDESNNRIGNPDCYYTPFANKPYYLTFRNKDLANWVGTVGGIPPGTPPAIAPYITNGQPVPSHLANEHLVPNDSRMYQMKLVLWRLLGEENRSLLARVKVAMSLSYQEDNYPYTGYRADFYKYYDNTGAIGPYGSGVQNNVLTGNPALNMRVDGINFPHGNGPDWATGLTDGYDYAATVMGGVDRNAYTKAPGSITWNAVNRAVLKLPFDYLYKADSKGFHSTTNLATFRKYINGIEGGNGTTFTEPELIADGQTPLAMAIYGRNYLITGNNAPSAAGVDNNPNGNVLEAGVENNKYRAIYFETQVGEHKQYYHGNVTYIPFRDFLVSDDVGGGNLRAGLGVGSVVDFFSPRAADLTFTNGGATDTRGFFPVIGSCQSNWLVVFTAGNDSDPNALTAPQAVQRLYANTKQMRGRLWNRSSHVWQEKVFEMDSGVRTLVVGFVDPYDASSVSVSLRDTLSDMAAYGAPQADGSPNYNSRPYFANNVPDLIASLKSVLMRINADRFASGATVIQPPIPGETSNTFLYSASYKVKPFDQWEGDFTKYKRRDNSYFEDPVWEFNEELRKMVSRDIRPIPYTASGAVGTSSTNVAHIDGLMNMTGAPDHLPQFNAWLKKYNGEFILGDMEHSGFAVVGKTPDYAWNGDNHRGVANTRVYLHTNRGFLHSVNDATGAEEWSFVPPPIFQGRIPSLKYTVNPGNVYGDWIEGDGITRVNSKPGALLDGGLFAREARDGSGFYKTVLLGCLGWGGNGLYAMDVTTPSGPPNFLWAIDNKRFENPVANSVQRWGKVAGLTNSAQYDYSDLGLTIVSPAVLSIDQKAPALPGDVGVLPGGLGYNLGADSQGKALYVFEPMDGGIIRRLGPSDFVDPTPTLSRQLGMLIAPITYIFSRDNQRTTTQIYTADHLGNVLSCDVTGPMNDWKLQSIFQLLSAGRDMDPVKSYEALSTPGLPIAIPRAIEYGWRVDNTSRTGFHWVFGGTADLMVPDQGPTRRMKNEEQHIFGIDLNKNLVGDATTTDLYSLRYRMDSADVPPIYQYGVNDSVADKWDGQGGLKGWRLKLRPSTPELGAEYVTTSPYLYETALYVSTFIPKPIPEDMEDRDLCPELGDSKLYGLDPETGAPLWVGGNGQALYLKNIKVAGMTGYGDELHVGVKQLRPGANAAAKARHPADIKDYTDTKLIIKIARSSQETTYKYNPNVPYIQYWRESY
ncbi:MAG: hypothetical protein LBD04_12290 [Synergistaceae bacterium]|nr:hypothetical protein [Synergistaceae bacterium]